MNDPVDDFEQISEDQIRTKASMLSGPNSYKKLLGIADEWRAADLTPVFIIMNDIKDTILACVSRETFGKYTH